VAAGFSFQRQWPPAVLVACLCLFMGFFSLGMGAITFVVASEIFPLPVRGKAMALTVFVNRLLRCVMCAGRPATYFPFSSVHMLHAPTNQPTIRPTNQPTNQPM